MGAEIVYVVVVSTPIPVLMLSAELPLIVKAPELLKVTVPTVRGESTVAVLPPLANLTSLALEGTASPDQLDAVPQFVLAPPPRVPG
jgi:hypothetical protein